MKSFFVFNGRSFEFTIIVDRKLYTDLKIYFVPVQLTFACTDVMLTEGHHLVAHEIHFVF